MKKQFEEISSQLDKVVGGQNLFNIDTQVNNGDLKCLYNCTSCLPGAVGSVKGTISGLETPNPNPSI
jgi:hypothetical protein